MPKTGPKVLQDLQELRALTHPLRARLFTELLARGQASVSDLANSVNEPVNKVSFHLRQLARYDFIEDAPEYARDRRDRWWRPVYPEGIDWDALTQSAAAPVARTKLGQQLQKHLARIQSFFSKALNELPDWRKGAFMHDSYLMMTPNEAAQFDREYLNLCTAWRQQIRARIHSHPNVDREQFGIFIFGLPLQDDED